MLCTLEVERREDGWWVTAVIDDVDDMGPYSTKKEATEFKKSLKQFMLYGDEVGFMTLGDIL